MKSRILLSIGAALCLFAACKKAHPVAQDSLTQTLYGSGWHQTSGTVTYRLPSGHDTTLDYFTPLSNCYKDNVLEFEAANHGIQHLGGNHCTVGEPDTAGFTWRLFGDTSIGIYNASETLSTSSLEGGVTYNAKLLTATSNTLHLQHTKITGSNPGDTLVYLDNFSR